jgi:two-component system nitrate/nitrite response regulator NarL
VHRNAIFRAGLAYILAGSRFNVVASARNLSDISGTKKIKNNTCVALIGLDDNAAEILLEASRLKQEIADLRIVVLARGSCPDEVLATIESGADAYLCKDITAEVLIKSLELVLLGPTIVTNGFLRADCGSKGLDDTRHQIPSPSSAEPLISGDHFGGGNGLSAREKAVLMCLTDGRSNKEIAHELRIAETTVKIHVKTLLRKIGAKNRTQAAMWALRHPETPSDDGT